MTKLDVESRVSGAERPQPARVLPRGSTLRPVFVRIETRDALLRRLLALGDIFTAVTVSTLAGVAFGAGFDLVVWGALIAPVWVLLAKLHGLYDRDQRSIRHLTAHEFPTILGWVTTSVAALAVWVAVAPPEGLPLSVWVRCWVTAAVVGVTVRAGIRSGWRRFTPPEAAMIVGEGPVADATRRKIELFRDMHVHLIGSRDTLTLQDLYDAPEWLFVDRIILASQTIDEELIAALVSFCRSERIKLSVVPPARGMFGTAVQLNHVADLPLVEYNTWDVPRSTMFLKRLVDITFATLGLLVLLPLLTLIGLAIKLDDRGPAFFSQERSGMQGKRFRMHKFRTMVTQAEDMLSDLISFDQLSDPMFKLRNDPRITRVGKLLRRASLDELPQLWNVLVGEMSLVGPRPEQVELVERYREEHLFRLNVKPGLTGPMQVYGRGELLFDERLAVERDYIENLSLRRDLHILAMTVSAVVSGRGAF